MLTQRANHAVTVLRQILQATENYARAVTRQTGLTTSQLLVLQILDDFGASSAGSVSTRMGISQATMTSLIHKLEAKGMILRERGDTDRRQVWLSISDIGRATLSHAPEGLQAKFGERFAALEDWEQSLLIAGLERTASLLDAEGLEATPVLDVGRVES
ncbi:MarR family winged helix-turn-helix transcriptional regulator [Hwanghaeella sp. LZ110]|jgi:MarR family transcriptional regulator, organic hydroperoxide resistance regulator|uniref:MarR family winged helix-turn-helix transcriptional regulator n=1 Tax=Hwanghaeella sp. LZ110 TaxID=3402810 RepID=UPI003B673E14